MSDIINVTIVGHSSTGLNALEQALQDDASLDLTRKLLLEGAVDPFEDLPVTGNVIVLELDDSWRDVLVSVASRARRNRTPMILVGPDGNTEMMRLALKSGARDFQTRPISPEELRLSIHQLANEKQGFEPAGSSAKVSVFISAKGGAGASTVISNIGHALQRRRDNTDVLLIDFDLQYGNLPLYFDESSNTRLTQALISNERIDTTLLDACLVKTKENMDLLASHSDQVFSSWETPHTTISNLLNLVADRYDQILIDIPRQIDPITFQAIEAANHICVVMQQTLGDLRQAKQVVSLLRDQGVSNDRIRILVNRHEKRNVLRAIDISDAFDGIIVSTLPNDYKRVSFTTDNAVSLVRKYRGAPISKAIVKLADTLFPPKSKSRRGLFGLLVTATS